jgi:hypothetical protein
MSGSLKMKSKSLTGYSFGRPHARFEGVYEVCLVAIVALVCTVTAFPNIFECTQTLSARPSQDEKRPRSPIKSGNETKYLAFQVFTNFTADSRDLRILNNGMNEPLVPGNAALRKFVLDIKKRIGTTGNMKGRLAVMLGPLCFDQNDAEVTKYIEKTFELALETDLAVGFHVDDSIFWRRRKDLWNDPQNVEALDWEGSPNTGRRLDWSKAPLSAAPQMCFNSKAIKKEVRRRSGHIGRAIKAGVKRLSDRKRQELFAGVIVGWETMIGQDHNTGNALGYRALLNLGFSRKRPPQDLNSEREKVVHEFIGLWTSGIVEAGVSSKKAYSHTAFLSRRAFDMGSDSGITYMMNSRDAAYSELNHFAPPWVAFGKNHRPGFSTYPQPGLFEDIYKELARHTQSGWASSEGTNMQPMSGPGQSGMNMESYLAKMFNHGATLTTIFSWGIGGESMKHMDYRLCTESDEALQAYRKFLRGEPLIEGKVLPTIQERLPPKIRKIQEQLPTWIQRTGKVDEAKALMQELDDYLKAKDFIQAEKLADNILKMISDP